MIRIENHLGTIEISQEYFAYLVGNAASSCYGVAGMVKSGTKQGLRSVFYKRPFADEGIRVRSENDKLIVDLHIRHRQEHRQQGAVYRGGSHGAGCEEGQCLRGRDENRIIGVNRCGVHAGRVPVREC